MEYQDAIIEELIDNIHLTIKSYQFKEESDLDQKFILLNQSIDKMKNTGLMVEKSLTKVLTTFLQSFTSHSDLKLFLSKTRGCGNSQQTVEASIATYLLSSTNIELIYFITSIEQINKILYIKYNKNNNQSIELTSFDIEQIATIANTARRDMETYQGISTNHLLNKDKYYSEKNIREIIRTRGPQPIDNFLKRCSSLFTIIQQDNKSKNVKKFLLTPGQKSLKDFELE